VRNFRASLTPAQNAELLVNSRNTLHATTILAFTAEIDKVNANRRSRCVSSRLFGILQSVQEFSSIADTFVSAHPEILALVWGCLKFTILVFLPDIGLKTLLTYPRPSIISYPSSTNYPKPSSNLALVVPDIQNINTSSPIPRDFRKLCVCSTRRLSTSARRLSMLLKSLVRCSFSY
jgi:hypothetical protein